MIKRDLPLVLQDEFIGFASEVIVNNLPSIDGLLPVNRKVLWALHRNKVTPDKNYIKLLRASSMSMVYYIFGDIPLTTAMKNMANNGVKYFYLDPKGSFGDKQSKTGKGASPRYIECRLSKYSMDILKSIDKNIVPMKRNFDDTEDEPIVLPSMIPNVLINTSQSIAVGLASKIAGHNLIDTCDSIINYIQTKDIDKSIDIIKCPDLPLGGKVIYDKNIFDKIYKTGHGSFTLLGKHKIKECDKYNIFSIYEIPYETTIEDIENKLREKCDKGLFKEIIDIHDASDRKGIQLDIYLKKNTNLKQFISKLRKYTPYESKFPCNFTILDLDGKTPLLMSLQDIFDRWIQHRVNCIKNEMLYDVKKYSEELNKLNGLKIINNELDKAIQIIRSSKTEKVAIEELIKYFKLNKEQAEYIATIRLVNINQDWILNKLQNIDELSSNVNKLNTDYNSEQTIKEIIISQLEEIKKKFGKPRRTEIIYEDEIADVSHEDLVEDFNPTLVLTEQQYIKKNRVFSQSQKLKDDDKILQFHQCNNKDDLLLFTNKGNVLIRKVYELDEHKPSTYGDFLPNLLGEYLQDDEKVIYISTTKDYKGSVIAVFENGNVARIDLQEYKSKQNRQIPMSAYNTNSNLISIAVITTDVDVLLVSQEGKALIINTSQLRPTKSRNTQGVVGMKIDPENNKVIGSIIGVTVDDNFNIETEKGKSKFIMLNDIAPNGKESMTEYLKGNRNTQGNFIYNTRQKNDQVIKLTQPEN
ncbi:DNA gyrase subunit A [Clostridium botulinum]|uniref:DNA gyrase/topoisomerase IV subunit A n=1 Tax=Clostridium botulinum TaxID=1491 RepID=UPI0013FC3644|nr:DNA topoisomerase (ATP-hydrolyzing) subunit A [Clostridium botulinum]MCD3216942.1 DNA gyrase subunit A [Clostridium botulinum C]MCD3245356.1 DNA gyrase subunit A [Clostridium botulinum C]MCD3261735.1 DNA gyrase subunit A [Clostridium botulinum C]NFV47897.1 DNA gyrase subunit A [Clostridium botulinum]